MMNFLQQAVTDLGKRKEYLCSIKYSGHFSDYGANIKVYGDQITLHLSKKWKDISDEIKIGLAQELLVSLFKLKKNTMHMDLYSGFIKRLHMAAPKEKPDDVLLESFNRVNEKYFYELMDVPNIVWGGFDVHQLGLYDYRTDRITISKVFQKDADFLDFVMHHEMLHRKHKFKSKNGRTLYHSSAFKKEERSYENFEDMEKNLKMFLTKSNLKKAFGLW